MRIDSHEPLTPDRYATVRAIFDEVADVTPDTREAALARACAGDTRLRSEVQSLLDALDRSGGWERSAAEHLGAFEVGDLLPEPLVIGERLGPYEVTRKVGEGGMGAVYEGQRADAAYTGRVAIKTLAAGLHGSAMTRRFLRERQILARLQHPNIATLLDGGTTERGIPYLVMEYVDGVPLDVFCRERRLSVAQRIDLFRQVCAAIDFAHRNLVVHRDLKPRNILVTADGVVKLLDFGIARLVTPDVTDSGATHSQLALTSAYASPEQARGEDVTTATDIYSAGVILYRLLTGAPPYDMEGKTPARVQEVLNDVQPPLPSSVVTNAAAMAAGLPDARALERLLRGELDAIVLMALRKEPERRYHTAAALGEDLHRFQRGLPVAAKPDTPLYRVVRFVRRHRALVAGSTIALASMVASTVVSLRQARVAREESARASRVTQYLQAIVGAADPSHYSTIRTGRRDVGLMEVLDSARSRVTSELANDPRTRADLYFSMGKAYSIWGRGDVALLLQDSARVLHARTVGERSVEVARDQHFAGVALQYLGRYEEAIARYREAVAGYAALPAAPDSERTDAEVSLGQLLAVGLHQFREGEPLMRSAEERELARPTPRAGILGLIQGGLATSLMLEGRWVAADSAFARAVASYARDSLRLRHERAILLANWGNHGSRRGDHAAAADRRRRALADVLASLGSGSLTEVQIRWQLGDDLAQLGRLDESSAMADTALRLIHGLSVPAPVEWANVLRLLGEVATRARAFTDADRWLSRAGDSLQQVTGAQRVGPETRLFTARARLAEARSQVDAARQWYERAYGVMREAMGETNPVTLGALSKLAAYERRSGRASRADSLVADSVRRASAAGGAAR